MRYLAWAFLLLIALSSHICHAGTLCPWINKATAFGILGTSEDSPRVNADVSATACVFRYRTENELRELRVTVEQANDPAQLYGAHASSCGPGSTPLRGIGNEAMACVTNKNGRVGGEVIGRVRDNVFTILLSTTASEPSTSRDLLMQKLGLVAEQVSGNLF
jgi:hypothetical protein